MPAKKTSRKRVARKPVAVPMPQRKSVIPAEYNKPKTLAISGIVGLLIAYIIGSRALDTGSYWEYLFTLVFLIISIRLLIRSLETKH